MAEFRITIRRVERPFQNGFDQQFAYLCQAFGMSSDKSDADSGFKVFKAIVLSTENGKGVSSTELSAQLKISRGAVINQLNNLLECGLIQRSGREYFARSRSMFRLMDELQQDVARMFNDFKQAALRIDQGFGLQLGDFFSDDFFQKQFSQMQNVPNFPARLNELESLQKNNIIQNSKKKLVKTVKAELKEKK